MSRLPVDPPLQMRLQFEPVEPQVRLVLVLSGLTVLVESPEAPPEEVWRLLCESGAGPEFDEAAGVSFPVQNLAVVQALPASVELVCDEHLEPLVLFLRLRVSDQPATLDVAAGELELLWFDGAAHRAAPVTGPAGSVLLTAHVPFVASAQAWGQLASFGPLVGLAGQARMNLDGFVEVSAPVPQLVESAPLPGLFRLDSTHFGLPAAFADEVDALPAFAWTGPRPTPELPPSSVPPLPLPLSRHAAEDLSGVVHRLVQSQAVVLWWDPGLGRRVMALAAVEALDAWPLLVVCPPSAVWVWQRHLELFGRTSSLGAHSGDARIVTYRDLGLDAAFASPAAVIFDDLPVVWTGQVADAVHRLDNLAGAFRIMTTSRFPSDVAVACEQMAALRPGEFTTQLPLAQRYPLTPERRATEHVGAYLWRRTTADTVEPVEFRRSSVALMPPSRAQEDAWAQVSARFARETGTAGEHSGEQLAGFLAEVLEVVSAGPPRALSPKLATAARLVQEAAAASRKVAVLCRHARSVALLRNMLRTVPVEVTEAAAPLPDAPVVLVRFDGVLPDLRRFDEVVVVDYPWSSALLDAAVGGPAESSGPSKVTVLHLDCPVEDRVAMLAAKRRELAALGPVSALTVDEMRFVLAPLLPAPPAARSRPLMLRQLR